jgi:hypothetical protein
MSQYILADAVPPLHHPHGDRGDDDGPPDMNDRKGRLEPFIERRRMTGVCAQRSSIPSRLLAGYSFANSLP